ncbi:MAG: toll/interleukin-1 receptor domain-containing protein [Candidatus Anammoxibacter sp.]
MALNLKQLIKRTKEYVALEANTKVERVSFVERFHILGREDVVLSVSTTDKKDPGWWVVGGSTPIALYAKSRFRSDEAISMHTGLMLRMSADDFEKSRNAPEDIGYDAFISHASEDKQGLVRPLAKALKKKGFCIWYDEFELRVGDSLRQSIDRGLVNSRYGIVVLSEAFFAKNWTQYELNGLVAREMEGDKVILPVWYKVTKADVLQFSPTLADKVAVCTKGNSIKKVVTELTKCLAESIVA